MNEVLGNAAWYWDKEDGDIINFVLRLLLVVKTFSKHFKKNQMFHRNFETIDGETQIRASPRKSAENPQQASLKQFFAMLAPEDIDVQLCSMGEEAGEVCYAFLPLSWLRF